MFKRINELLSKFSKLISLILFVTIVVQSVVICNLQNTLESFDRFSYFVRIGNLMKDDKIICTEDDYVFVESSFQQFKIFKGFSVDTLIQIIELPGNIIDHNNYIDDSSLSIENNNPFYLQLICQNKKSKRFYLVYKGSYDSLNILHLEKIYQSETKHSKIISLSLIEKTKEMLTVLQSDNLLDVEIINITNKIETTFRLPNKTILRCGYQGIIGFDGEFIFRYELEQNGFQIAKKNDTGEKAEIENCKFPLNKSLYYYTPDANMVYNGKTLFFIDQDTLVYTAYNNIELEDTFDDMIVTKNELYYIGSKFEKLNVTWSKVLGSFKAFGLLKFVCIYLENVDQKYYQLCIYQRDKLDRSWVVRIKPDFHELDIPIQAFLTTDYDLCVRGESGAIFKMIEVEIKK